ncbi:putative membrane transporter protein YfcA [bioreactor metagenome]|uniref:Putative membrane transporter protein YfcA n=1 Tax=bioreactor metagenome TaxID=1076179 RepID=A0A645A8S4_9ZZZZ
MEIQLVIICIVSFFAGFIDSIAGGGGLIQTPAILFLFPQYPVATLLGTTKIPSFSGTALATYQFSKKASLNPKLFLFLIPAAFSGSALGAWSITIIEDDFIKPVILVILIIVAVYFFLKKDLGSVKSREVELRKQIAAGCIFGFIIGLYDGMIGPGTGSFFILSFILFMGFDFIAASAHAKMLNLATNLSAIALFAATGNIVYRLAIPMAICNMGGAFLGSKLALLRGNRFIRIFFLLVVTATIVRFAFELF